ncbi:MAG: nucleoside 2-deoxyribosyltransferase domain-containing protein [Myxococcota bacterium]
MNVVHTTEMFPRSWSRSLFLAGPSPRSASPLPSWRPRALAKLRAAGFGGVVFVPEPPPGGAWPSDTSASTQWELEALALADVVVFWVPRDLEHMPGFTTNVEFGAWVGSHKVVLGHPPEAPLTGYLDVLAERVDGQTPSPTLDATLAVAIERLTPGAARVDGERHVPIDVWRMDSFQDWYRALVGRGRLVEATVRWVRRCAGRLDLALVDVGLESGGTRVSQTLVFTEVPGAIEVRTSVREVG